MASEDIAIEFKNTSKTYEAKGLATIALKPLNLIIKKGECFGLLGHNGAGKTTIISILAGINKPTSGDVLVENISVTKNPEITKRMLGVVQQELVADSFFNLRVMLRIQSKLSGAVVDNEWINFLLEKLLLTDHVAKTTRELSGGMKRRMMIARALVHKPKYLILDEPTAGVDIQLRHSMWEFISELNKNGITIILTTHYLEEAEEFCNRICILKSGGVVTLKENKDLLALGGDHKISCVLDVNNISEWREQYNSFLIEHGLVFETIKNKNSGKQDVKISLSYQNGGLNSFLEASNKVAQLMENIQAKVNNVYTESPNLEDVYIKINDGILK